METETISPLTIGQVVPDFEFEYFQDESFRKMKFSDLLGKWIVIVFYPADFTFVCPTELEELAHNYDAFKALGAEVISVSTDTVFVHKAWHDFSPAIKQITYPMAADPTAKLAKAFGVHIPEEGLDLIADGGLSLRGTFIIDTNGVLQAIEINSNDIGRNTKETLRKLEAAIFVKEHPGQVCPASWAKGGKTLKPGIDLVGKI
jgi:peroxiredoxin (alkyl hydroperoxide reductase subunit C)